MILLSQLVKYPVKLEGGYELLQPIQSPIRDAFTLRLHDPESDLYIQEHLAGWVLRKSGADTRQLLDQWLTRMLRQLDAAAWAMRKFDIPPSWQTAYYRACGEWPEGFA